ncbi:MAG: (4Fe-4S)-binding protein [Actinobacteria bacterium]|nr:(4Fe-4S)-binding protein [Actinomycetota bacterium]
MAKITKKVKTIKVDADKCNGCRGCEIVCSAFHSTPAYSGVNPAKSRIRVITNRLADIWLPVFAGEYSPAECMGRDVYVIDGKEYDECGFCRAVCPSRDLFKDPDSGLPLKCDMCEGEEQPLCVQWCLTDVLTYEEREEEVEEEAEMAAAEAGVDSLIDQYGLAQVADILARRGKGAES